MANQILWEIARGRLKEEGFSVVYTPSKLICRVGHALWGNVWIKNGKVSEKSTDSLIRRIRYAKG
jgi:hypothetical protein